MEMITSFKRKETRFLSNFYPVTVTLDGEQYAAVEDAFQAAKPPWKAADAGSGRNKNVNKA